MTLFQRLLLLSFSFFISANVAADCSIYLGRVTINEVYRDSPSGPSANDFIEFKIIDDSISLLQLDTWEVTLCDGGGCATKGLSDPPSSSSYPYHVLSGSAFPGTYIDTGNYRVELYDGNGDLVDFLTVYSATPASSPESCSFPYDIDFESGGSGHRVLKRTPDGVGNWDKSSGASEPPTDEANNDESDIPSTQPNISISINDVSVIRGNTANFTVTLSEPNFDFDIEITYKTVDGTAVDGVDYTGIATGSVTVPKGNTIVSISVDTLPIVGSDTYFNLLLQSATESGDPTVTLASMADGWGRATLSSSAFCYSASYADTFATQVYNRQDGSGNWSADWIENDDGSVTTGQVTINSGQLVLAGSNSAPLASDPFIVRSVDLSGYDFAELSIDIASSGTLDTADQAFIEISSNGGSSWTTLQTITDDYTGLVYFNISTYLSNDTRIRLRIDAQSAGSFNADTKQIFFDDVTVNASTVDCGADHFGINHTGTGISCSETPITISAYDSTPSVKTTYQGQIDLNTNTGLGDWSIITGNGTLNNGTANDGLASYTFATSDNGQVSLGLTHTTPGTVNIDVLENAGTAAEDPTLDPDLIITSSGFIWADGGGNPVTNMTAGQSLTTLQLWAYDTDPGTNTCEALFPDGTNVDVELGSQCIDPGSCIASPIQQVSITNDGTTTPIPNPENQISGSNWRTVSLLFSSGSTALLDVEYLDAGKIQLNARHELLDGDGNPTGNYINGSTQLVSKPDYLELVSVQDVSGTPNPGTTTALGGTSKFVSAGDLFHAKVQGRNAIGDITPNFGNESSTPQPLLSSSLVAPVGGDNGSAGVTGNWINDASAEGQLTFADNSNGITFSEVGAVTLTPYLVDYLGVGTVTGNASATIGRFYPDHFDVTTNAPILSASSLACGFVYRDQPITFSTQPEFIVTAKNASGNTTRNYDGNFFILPTSLTTTAYQLTDGTSAYSPVLNTTTSFIQNGGYDGEVRYQFTDFTFSRNAIPDASEAALTEPLIEITLLDSPTPTTDSVIHDNDGVCYPSSTSCTDVDLSFNLLSLDVFLGRAILSNSYGPETSNLDMNATLQIWDGNPVNGYYWQTNVLENGCTTTVQGDFSLGSWLTDREITGSPSTSILNWNNWSLGEGSIVLQATGAGNTGSIPIILSVPTYLQYDFNGVGLENPQGIATFGVYQGQQPIIFRQRVFR